MQCTEAAGPTKQHQTHKIFTVSSRSFDEMPDTVRWNKHVRARSEELRVAHCGGTSAFHHRRHNKTHQACNRTKPCKVDQLFSDMFVSPASCVLNCVLFIMVRKCHLLSSLIFLCPASLPEPQYKDVYGQSLCCLSRPHKREKQSENGWVCFVCVDVYYS